MCFFLIRSCSCSASSNVPGSASTPSRRSSSQARPSSSGTPAGNLKSLSSSSREQSPRSSASSGGDRPKSARSQSLSRPAATAPSNRATESATAALSAPVHTSDTKKVPQLADFIAAKDTLAAAVLRLGPGGSTNDEDIFRLMDIKVDL